MIVDVCLVSGFAYAFSAIIPPNLKDKVEVVKYSTTYK